MSIELLIVLVRFCHATGHFSLAVNLSMEVIAQSCQRQRHSFSSSPTLTNQTTDKHLRELLKVLLLDLLPYCQEAATRLDTRLRASQWEPKRWVASPDPQALQTLIKWSDGIKEEEEDSWFVETVLECRHQWKLQEKRQVGNSSSSTDLLVLPTTNLKAFRLLKVLGPEWRLKVWLRMQEYVRQVLLVVREAPSKMLEDPKQRNQVVMTLLSFWIVWRYRRRLLSMSSATLQKFIWQPAREIVDAIVPIQR